LAGDDAISIRLIGPFEIQTATGTLSEAQLPGRAATLVKLLALTPHHTSHRDEVIDVLWPGSDTDRGRNNLHKAMHTLRRATDGDGHDLLCLRSGMVTFAGPVWVDLDEFHDAAVAATSSGGPADLLHALELARGELLPADIYEDWALAPRERYRATVIALRYALAEKYARNGSPDLAAAQLHAVLALDPHEERAHRELMRLHAAGGDSTNALRQYEVCVSALRDIGAEPSRETVALLREITEEASPFRAGSTPCPHIESVRTVDGFRVAYYSLGRGFPLVHMPALPWNNIELEWQVPAWRAWHQRLANGRMLVRYDGRGQGISDRRDSPITVETLAHDLDAVVGALALETFDLYAPIHAAMAAFSYASAHPERVRRLVCFTAYARGRDYRDQPYIAGGYQLAQDDWPMFCQFVVSNAFAMGPEEVVRAVTSVFVNSSSPEHQAEMMSGYLLEEVTELLPRVPMPVLVLEPKTASGLVPADVVDRLVAALPQGEVRPIEAPLIPIIGDVESMIATIHEFLDAD
jgi:DNA-binding SARP family transcriptional activator/pimeloyl-ACP methyl ester carboxylesterase